MKFFHSILRLFFIYFTITGVKIFYVIPTSLLYKSSVYRRSTVIHVSGEMYNFVYFFSSLAAYFDRLEIPHTCTCTPVYCNALTFFTFVFHLLPKPTFGYFFVIHLSQFWNISTHFNSRCLKTSTATACFDALWKNMENKNYYVVTLVHNVACGFLLPFQQLTYESNNTNHAFLFHLKNNYEAKNMVLLDDKL